MNPLPVTFVFNPQGSCEESYTPVSKDLVIFSFLVDIFTQRDLIVSIYNGYFTRAIKVDKS